MGNNTKDRLASLQQKVEELGATNQKLTFALTQANTVMGRAIAKIEELQMANDRMAAKMKAVGLLTLGGRIIN